MYTLAVILTTATIEAALGVILLERYYVIKLKEPLSKRALSWERLS